MKRIVIGGLAILSAATLPFTGFAYAASTVDYEYSVGQVEGADTINWVVEATDDGGYVVGGQTVMCYRTPKVQYFDAGDANSTGDDLGTTADLSITQDEAGPEPEPERISYKDCVKYYQENPDLITFENYNQSGQKSGKKGGGTLNNSPSGSFSETLSHSILGQACLGGGIRSAAGLGGDLSGDSESEYQYLVYCTDYIAKFKTDGTKEWLTTFKDSYRPVAVKKVNTGYRLLDEKGGLYNFSSKGVEGENDYVESDTLGKAYFNEDGSFVTVDGINVYHYSADGTRSEGGLEYENGNQGEVSYTNVFPAGDGYVIVKTTHNYSDNTESYSIVDASKNLGTTKERNLAGVTNPFLISANKNGDVIVGYTNEDNKPVLVSFDKNGKKLGEYTGTAVEDFAKAGIGYKDFAVGVIDANAGPGIPTTMGMAAPVAKIIKFNRDMTIRYEYTGSGSEFIADVAELNDKSLAGVGLAIKGSTAIPVTGDANGGYLRLVASTNTKPTTSTEKVKNPKTFDGVDVLAIAGSALLLGFGVFLRKHLVRRASN